MNCTCPLTHFFSPISNLMQKSCSDANLENAHDPVTVNNGRPQCFSIVFSVGRESLSLNCWHSQQLFTTKTGVITISENLSQIHLKNFLYKNLLADSTNFSCTIILKFYTKHGSNTVIVCANFQNDWTTTKVFMRKLGVARFEFNMESR